MLFDITNSEFGTILTIIKTTGDFLKKKTRSIAFSGITAAVYVVLTVVSSFFGLSGGIVQLRLSEALTVLPMLFPETVPGLFIGCLISNAVTGCNIVDIITGSLVTLAAAVLTVYLGKKNKYLGILSPVVLNTAVIPFVLRFSYRLDGGLCFFFFTVFCGEFVSCGILGLVLYKMLLKYGINLTDR